MHKSFDETIVLTDVNFRVEEGEFVVLVGPSGCGKSTILRTIAGLETPTSGDVFIGNRRVNDVPARDRDIAMVFQSYALYPHLTVYDNMAFGLKMRKTPKPDIDERVREAADFFGLSELLHRKPRQLSGGQRQRVALGRAVVRKPSVFLFDEPLSNLDAKLRAHTRTELSRLHKRLGTAMVYVTHDQVEAMTLGQRIVVLKDGFIQQIDTPLNVYKRPLNRFVGGFIGSPAMNFVNAAITGKEIAHGQIKFTAPSFVKLNSKSTLTVGLRPEQIAIGETSGDRAKFNLVVDVVEPVGNEMLVYGRMDEEILVIRAEATAYIKPDDTIPVSFDPKTAHYFDTDSGESIRDWSMSA
ncbi:sn-glycerol-3-phosphate ABC transporter ATP-binding protein UgpC [bacterium]|nr:sn-glycerol-3-phosphate ABC transporter ATP-binding protein UgpC [bacterium]